MRWTLGRLRPLQLVGLTLGYWLGLIAVKLGGAIAAAWQLGRLPPNQAQISAGLENASLRVSLLAYGKPVWEGVTSLGPLVLWIAGPPLILWLTSRWTRELESGPGAVSSGGEEAPAGRLPSPPPSWDAGRADRREIEKTEARRPSGR